MHLSKIRAWLKEFESPLSAREAAVICAAVVITVVGGAALRLAFDVGPDAMRTWKIGGDFTEFFIAGTILNQHQESRLYDLDLQKQLYVLLQPGETWLRLPYLYPPFVALLFRPLAVFPLPVALLVFLSLLPVVFLAALCRLLLHFGPSSRDARYMMFLAALSFPPFLIYSWLGAQISVLGLVAIAMAVLAEDRGRRFAAGLWLSLCLYKPSLLVLVLPMLLVARRFRLLVGFCCGAALLTSVSLWIVGPGAMLAFLGKMAWMSRGSTLNSGLFNAYRYVDLNSFVRLFPFGTSAAGRIGEVLAGGFFAAFLLASAWRYRNSGREARLLLWSATLAFGLAVNIYTPYYDCLLLVVSASLAVTAWTAIHGRHPRGSFLLMLLLLWIAPWLAEILARRFALQIYTLVLLGYGTLLLSELRRAADSDRCARPEPPVLRQAGALN